MKEIKENSLTGKSILTIHNQESESEREFFANGTGAITNHLKNNLGIDISHWEPTGKSSLISVLEYLPATIQLLLVHNIFTTKEDVMQQFQELKILRSRFMLFIIKRFLIIPKYLITLQLFPLCKTLLKLFQNPNKNFTTL